MGAPKGNKYAKGHHEGRPREHDYEKEAADLLAWSLKPDALSLYEFTDSKTYLASELSEFAKREKVFAEALHKAKERIAIRRERMCNAQALDKTIWARTVHVYDHLMVSADEFKAERDNKRKKDLIDHEAKVKAENNGGSQSDSERLEAALSLINYLQSESSARNAAVTSMMTESKS